MEQSRLKLRISRMFRSSFGSCQTRNISDVMEKAVFPQVPSSQHRFKFQAIDQTSLMSPKARPFPSICKPRCPESAQPIVNNTCIRLSKDVLRRRKVCVSDRREKRAIFTPKSPFDDFYSETHKRKSKNKTRRSKSRASRSNRSTKIEPFPFGSSSKESYYSVRNSWWPSSDDEDEDEDEKKTLFSSRSLSSESSFSCVKRNRESEMGVKMAESFAVVKRSSDPYSDFRTSMVEMIVEKQIFAATDLENLLQCFLSLNSHHHQNIIVQVFTEIWEALFCNWC